MSEVGTSGWTFPSDVVLPSGFTHEDGLRPYTSLTASQTITDNTWSTISWDSAYYDTDAMWESWIDPTILKVNHTAMYEIIVTAYRATRRTDYRLHALTLWADGGGGRVISRYGPRNTQNSATTVHYSCLAAHWLVEAQNDWEFSVDFFQDNTGNVTTTHTFALSIVRLSGRNTI